MPDITYHVEFNELPPHEKIVRLQKDLRREQLLLGAYDEIWTQLKDLLRPECPGIGTDELVSILQARLEHPHGVLQSWVAALGLRHQGVLMACVRGCDNVPKEDATKLLARCLRAVMLRSFDPRPSSFIENVTAAELGDRMRAVLENHDHYPVHYLLHLAHGAEIIGYKHPDAFIRQQWSWFYIQLARCFHLTPETETALDERLGAPEDKFSAQARSK